MSNGRALIWTVVIVIALVPLSNLATAIFDSHASLSVADAISKAVLPLIISGGIAYFMVKSARGTQILREREAASLRAIAEQPLAPVTPAQALLKKGEVAYASVNAELKETQTVGYSGGGRGISVRVAKGVTLRSSSHRSHAVKGVVTVSSGELVVTDNRVIFAGDAKSFSIALENILNVTPYFDGIGLHDSHKNYLLGCDDHLACRKLFVVLHKVLNETRAA